MIEHQKFCLLMQDDTELYCYRWLPLNDPKGIVIILHGMAEHALRYDFFAQTLVAEGFAVYACDHRGHGQTGLNMGKLGFFSVEDGWQIVINDIQTFIESIQVKHTDKPLYLFGHSMGSFLARSILLLPDQVFSGIILSGTSLENQNLCRFALKLATLLCQIQGRDYPSALFHYLTFGTFNQSFKPTNTPYDWLSRDNANVRNYQDDPLCGFRCTNAFYRDLFMGLLQIHDVYRYTSILNKPSLFLLAGSRDPVSHFGKDIPRLATIFQEAGFPNVASKVYPDGRHEMLQEINRDEVIRDIIYWLQK